jgi:hypothetical protein
MKKLLIFALVLTLVSAGVMVSTAHAQTVTDCQALIDQTAADLAGVSISGNNAEQTRANLAAKLTAASAKLTEGKYLDAIDKLLDFRTSVEKLATAPKPKISLADAQLLITDVDNAIACIQGLIVEG